MDLEVFEGTGFGLDRVDVYGFKLTELSCLSRTIRYFEQFAELQVWGKDVWFLESFLLYPFHESLQPPSFGFDMVDVHVFKLTQLAHENVVEVPLSFHRQWMYRYPNYVLFNCDSTKHFIRVRRYGRRCFFADGLKDFKRAHNVNESAMVHFIASDINTTLSVDVMGPIHRQVHVRWTNMLSSGDFHICFALQGLPKFTIGFHLQ
ncbi:hypothetical protein JHK84_031748 [Glycine max]|nr:hypothetical protein JHK84_031748 [Glycine max]